MSLELIPKRPARLLAQQEQTPGAGRNLKRESSTRRPASAGSRGDEPAGGAPHTAGAGSVDGEGTGSNDRPVSGGGGPLGWAFGEETVPASSLLELRELAAAVVRAYAAAEAASEARQKGPTSARDPEALRLVATEADLWEAAEALELDREGLVAWHTPSLTPEPGPEALASPPRPQPPDAPAAAAAAGRPKPVPEAQAAALSPALRPKPRFGLEAFAAAPPAAAAAAMRSQPPPKPWLVLKPLAVVPLAAAAALMRPLPAPVEAASRPQPLGVSSAADGGRQPAGGPAAGAP